MLSNFIFYYELIIYSCIHNIDYLRWNWRNVIFELSLWEYYTETLFELWKSYVDKNKIFLIWQIASTDTCEILLYSYEFINEFLWIFIIIMYKYILKRWMMYFSLLVVSFFENIMSNYLQKLFFFSKECRKRKNISNHLNYLLFDPQWIKVWPIQRHSSYSLNNFMALFFGMREIT